MHLVVFMITRQTNRLFWMALCLCLELSVSTLATLTGRGIGRFGVRLSSFCGPLILITGASHSNAPIIRFGFTMGSLQLSLPFSPTVDVVSSEFLVNDDGMTTAYFLTLS